jgi:XRE family transcriptional regulator, fatty acid utilization regulator
VLLNHEGLRYIFGLKLRSTRKEKQMSLKDLSRLTGLSPSYINEIEKGKKYPKSDKILSLTRALNVKYDDLTSVKLDSELQPLSALLENNLLRELPLEVFGISGQALFEIMSHEPQRFSALVGTILELARNFNIKVDDIFSATLRAYLHIHNNYFPDIEDQVKEFRKKYEFSSDKDYCARILEENYNYVICEEDFGAKNPDLDKIFYFVKNHGQTRKLYLNKKIGTRQKIYVLARELGYSFLNLNNRFMSSFPQGIDSYEVLHNHFLASYFASALLIERDTFIAEVKEFFARTTWDPKEFSAWVNKYPGIRRNFVHRFSQVLPHFFGLDNIFYFRFNYKVSERSYKVVRELHISDLHTPHRLQSEDHYCRRWIATSLLRTLVDKDQKFMVGIQRSQFHGTESEYLCFSMAYDLNLNEDMKEGVTIGIKISDQLKEGVKFWDDPKIPRRVVSTFCEMCDIENCAERIAPPSAIKEQRKGDSIQEALDNYELPDLRNINSDL